MRYCINIHMEKLSQNKSEHKPRISEYLDYRKFMSDFYSYKKNAFPHFSHAVWSNKAGFKSRSFLRLVMLAKRSLTSESIPPAAKALELNKQETEFFINLVNYNQSTDFKSRDFFLNRLMKTSVAKKITPIHDSYRYLTNHLAPRVQTLLSIDGIKKNSVHIAALLKASEAQINQALEALESLHLAQFDSQTKEWKSVVENFQISSDLGNVALQSFHQKCLTEAVEAISLKPETRNFSSLLLVLSEAEYKAVLKEYDQFTDGLLLKYQGAQTSESPDQKIYQINTNLIPVSQTLIREQKTNTSRVQELNDFADTQQNEANL